MTGNFNFLKSYCRLLENTEVPPRFALWTGIASLLATLQRNIWIEQESYRIYPNFYFLLVAGAGQKKDTAINLPKKLLNRLEPKLKTISNKITPESLIATLEGDKNAKGKTTSAQCGGIVIAGELATFLDSTAHDRGLGPILTALFDCPDVFEHSTIGRGLIKLVNTHLSILGGSTVELLRDCLPKNAIGGGFSSRTLFVYEDQLAPPVAWIKPDAERVGIENQLVEYLQELTKLEGAVKLDPNAIDLYTRIYNDRYAKRVDMDSAGLKVYENRRHLHLLKCAMAIMVSEDPHRLEMTTHDISTAEYLLQEVENFLPRIIQLLVTTEQGHTTNQIKTYIESKKEVKRSDLTRRFALQYNAMELSMMVDTLIKSNLVKIENITGNMTYKWIG
jgi:hypothetical protein